MTSTKRRNTGPSLAVRDLVRSRDMDACVRCGAWDRPEIWPRHQIHHRVPRGLGGSRRPEINSPANLVLVCAVCHARIESHRDEAREDGWLVRQGHDPALTPIPGPEGWVLLTHDGQIQECP